MPTPESDRGADRDEPSLEGSGDDKHCDALLLRNVDYGESDRILTLLTGPLGKIACLARGARRSKKRFGGVLQPFSLLRVEIDARRSSMAVLKSAQIVHPARITTDLDRTSAAYASLELLRELTPEHSPDPELMELGVAMMRALDAPSCAPQALLVSFETRLLAICGFEPMLDACGYCGKQPGPNKAAGFDPAQGHLVCTDCGGARFTLSGSQRAALMLAADGDFHEAADLLARDPVDLTSARRAMRALTEQRLGRELRSELMALT